jgi:uncharacterized membrane protein YebE (DUF533 family)
MSQNQTLLAIQVWIATAWADGKISPAEQKGMEALIGMAKLTDAERQTARGWLKQKIDLDDVEIEKITAEERGNIYSAALSVVAMDDDIASGELKFLDRLRLALELDDATVATIRQRAGI